MIAIRPAFIPEYLWWVVIGDTISSTSSLAMVLSSESSFYTVTNKLASTSGLKLALLTLKYCICIKYFMAFLRRRGKNSLYTNTMHCASQIHISLGQVSELDFSFLPFYLHLKFLFLSLINCRNSCRTRDCPCLCAACFLSLKKKSWTKGIPIARSSAWIWVSIWLWVEAEWMKSVCPTLKMKGSSEASMLWIHKEPLQDLAPQAFWTRAKGSCQDLMSCFSVLTSRFIPGLWETDIYVFGSCFQAGLAEWIPSGRSNNISASVTSGKAEVREH